MNHSATIPAPARNVRVDAFVAQMRRADRAVLTHAIEQQDMAELERAAIAARIKQARQEVGLSQPEMADALGVISRTYQNYESQKEPRTPWALMNQIAAVTGKTTEWLIHGNRTTAENGAGPDRLGAVEDRLVGLIETQNQLLLNQSELIGEIRALLLETRAIVEGLGVPDGSTLQAHVVQVVREAAALATAPGTRSSTRGSKGSKGSPPASG